MTHSFHKPKQARIIFLEEKQPSLEDEIVQQFTAPEVLSKGLLIYTKMNQKKTGSAVHASFMFCIELQQQML